MKSIVILNDSATEGSKNKQNRISDSEESSKRDFFACKSSSFSLLLQFISFIVVFYFWGGESNESVAFD